MTVYLKPSDIAELCGSPNMRRDSLSVRCPAHKDEQASLRVSKGRKATIMYCHAGCSLTDICQALEIHTEQLYYDYDPTNPHSPIASLRMKEMLQQRKAPDRWELEPHESLQDVLYEVTDIEPEVWATVYLRWQDILDAPFMDAMEKQWVVMDAVCGDLFVEQIDQGWDWSAKRKSELIGKLYEEWRLHGKRA